MDLQLLLASLDGIVSVNADHFNEHNPIFLLFMFQKLVYEDGVSSTQRTCFTAKFFISKKEGLCNSVTPDIKCFGTWSIFVRKLTNKIFHKTFW